MGQAISRISILLKDIGKNTRPGSPEGVVKNWKPVKEVDLPTEPVEQGEPKLRPQYNHILVKVIADKPGNPPVSPASMNQYQL